jgi:plastocyanin
VRARSVQLRSIAGSVALTIGLAACGSGKGGDGNVATGTSSSLVSSGSCQAQAGLTGTVSDHGTERVNGTEVTLEAADTFFEPTCVVVSGGTLTVTIRNTGSGLHNFSVTSLGIDEDVAAGQSITVDVRFDGTGPLSFFCKYHASAGMQGAFVPA